MQNKSLDMMSLNICGSLLKDQKGEIIYPGDILIKNNEHIEFADKKFNNTPIEDLILNNEYEEMTKFLKSLPYPCSFFSLDDDISVAEYFNIKEIKNPVLAFHGLLQSMSFNINHELITGSNNIHDYTKYYKHLTDDESKIYKIGIISTNEFVKNEKTIKNLIKKITSKFSGKAKILKTFSLKDGAAISEKVIFKYRLKDLISYKKAKKFQKGIFERLNWYKNFDKIMLPWLHFYLKDENLFNMALKNDYLKENYFNSNEEMVYKWINLLYYFEQNEDKINHKYFSIFCTKYKDSNKRIYFYKGR